MKNLLLIAAASLFIAGSARAQYPEEFTKDQADSTIKYRTAEIATLNADIKTAKAGTEKATADLTQRLADNNKCRESLYAMLGSDRNGYNAFREGLTRDEQELATLRSMTPQQQGAAKDRVDALEAHIRAERSNKLVVIPDHMRRVQALSNGYQDLKKSMVPPTPPNTTYTVGTWAKDRDCLWNIAKKPEIYNDPFAWPKIWRANMDKIHNPDVIRPGWQLSIVKSPVTPEDKDLTGYRHHTAK